MAFFVVVPTPQAPVQNEIKKTLYTNKELYSGPNINGVKVIDTEGLNHFGRIEAVAWPVTDGSGPNACVVGHLRGTCVQVANSGANSEWHYSLGLVFEDERLKGSTLVLSGTSGINGEWSIVGGTGQLTMATGTLKRRAIERGEHSRVSELKIHAYYTPM